MELIKINKDKFEANFNDLIYQYDIQMEALQNLLTKHENLTVNTLAKIKAIFMDAKN